MRAFCLFPSEREPKMAVSDPKQMQDDWISALPLHRLSAPAASLDPTGSDELEEKPHQNTGSCFWPSALEIPGIFPTALKSRTAWNVESTLIIYSRGVKKKNVVTAPTENAADRSWSQVEWLLIKQATMTHLKNKKINFNHFQNQKSHSWHLPCFFFRCWGKRSISSKEIWRKYWELIERVSRETVNNYTC